MRKKVLSFFLSVLFLFGSMAALGGCKREQPPVIGIQTITIPDVTVDLVAPENKVLVDALEVSEVFDATGRKLTAEEWLLNSKFSKAYIKSLGVGEYTFTYQSATKTGTIRLIITDEATPAYVFAEKLPTEVACRGSVSLPLLIKEQDSYQDSFEPTYQLLYGEDIMEVVSTETGYFVDNLAAGEYIWQSTVATETEQFYYQQKFAVQSFDGYLQTNVNTMLKDMQSGGNVVYGANGWEINTMNEGFANYQYNVSLDVLKIAMQEGKKKLTFSVACDQAIANGNGVLWGLNGKERTFGIDGDSAKVNDYSSNAVGPYITKVRVEGGKYIYDLTFFLSEERFTASNPMGLLFQNARVTATMSVTIE